MTHDDQDRPDLHNPDDPGAKSGSGSDQEVTVPEIIPLSELSAEITRRLDREMTSGDPAGADPVSHLPSRLGAALATLKATGAGRRELAPIAAEAATSILNHPAGRRWPLARMAERAITAAAAEALYDEQALRSPDGIPAADSIEPHRAVIRRSISNISDNSDNSADETRPGH